MKKLLLLTLLTASFASQAQENLLQEKPISTLGDAMTWSAGDQSYTFVTADLPKLVASPTNTSNVFLYPEDGTINTPENRAKGAQGFYVDMGESQKVGTVTTTWEGAAADAYKIYLTDETPTLDILDTDPIYAAEKLGQYTENTAPLPSGAQGRYLVFQVTNATNWGWGVKIRSISAAAPTEDVLTVFTVKPTIISGNTADMTFSFKNQFGLDIPADNVSLSVSENAELNDGKLTINDGNIATVTASKDDVSLSQNIYIATAPNIPETDDIKTPIFTNGNTENNATAGWEVRYNGGAVNNGTLTFENDLVAQSFSDAQCIFFHNSITTGAWDGNINPNEKEYKSLKLDVFPTKNVVAQIEFESVENLAGGHTYKFNIEACKWNTIEVTVLGATKLNNLSLRFTEENKCDILLSNIYFTPIIDLGEAKPETIELSSPVQYALVGENISLSYIVKDQYGSVMEDVALPEFKVVSGEATFNDNVIIPLAKGKVTVEAIVNENVKTTLDLNVCADINDYCMTGAKVTSDNPDIDGAKAIDGGAEPTNNGGEYIITDNESAGEHEHWILAELARPYDLDLILASWEGACPRDYDVYVGETQESLTKMYSITGHNEAFWYDRFSGEEMKNVRFIKIVTTYNATRYGLKLFEIKAYGTESVYEHVYELALKASAQAITTDEKVKVEVLLSDQYGSLPADDVQLTATGGTLEEGTFSATEAGDYTITAEYNSLKANVTVKVVEAARPADGERQHNAYSDNGEADTFKFNENYSDAPKTFANEYRIELAYPQDLNLIKLNWKSAPEDYEVEFVHWYMNFTSHVNPAETRNSENGMDVDRIWQTEYENANDYYEGSALSQVKTVIIRVNQPEVRALAANADGNYELAGINTYGNESAEDGLSGVEGVAVEEEGTVNVYTLQGVMLRRGVDRSAAVEGLPAGLYIVGTQKVTVK